MDQGQPLLIALLCQLPGFSRSSSTGDQSGLARMTKDKPSAGQPVKLSRSEEARRIIEEYVNDLLEIIKKLRRRLN